MENRDLRSRLARSIIFNDCSLPSIVIAQYIDLTPESLIFAVYSEDVSRSSMIDLFGNVTFKLSVFDERT